jgi:hypothetical protein
MFGQSSGHLNRKITNFNRVYGNDTSICYSSYLGNLKSTFNLCKHRKQSNENPRKSNLASTIKHSINAKQLKSWRKRRQAERN